MTSAQSPDQLSLTINTLFLLVIKYINNPGYHIIRLFSGINSIQGDVCVCFGDP